MGDTLLQRLRHYALRRGHPDQALIHEAIRAIVELQRASEFLVSATPTETSMVVRCIFTFRDEAEIDRAEAALVAARQMFKDCAPATSLEREIGEGRSKDNTPRSVFLTP